MTAFRAAILVAISAVPIPAFAATVLVQPGDDLAAAFQGLSPGDEFVFGAGTYDLGRGLDVTVDGTLAAPIKIRGEAGTVLEAPEGDFTLRIEGTNFVVQDLEIHGPGTALTIVGEDILVANSSFMAASIGVDCEDCGQVSIQASEFAQLTDARGSAIQSAAFVNGSVSGNWIHDGAGDGILLTGRTANSSIDGNVVENMEGDGIHAELPVEVDFAQTNTVTSNYVGSTAGHGIVAVGAVAVTVNIITDFMGDGINSTLGAVTAGSVISHNTVVGATTCFRGNEWSLSSGTNVLANNALYCDDTAIMFTDGVGMFSTVTSNLYTGNADFPGDSVLGGGLTDFADAAAGDFYPSDGSPLIDAGLPDYASRADFNGNGRDAAPDIGAYERSDSKNPGVLPGGAFKGETGEPTPGADAGGGGSPDTGGGTFGGVMSGGSSNFPDRANGCNCSSVGGSAPLLPLFLLALVGLRRRR